jgi:hypothetical protein
LLFRAYLRLKRNKIIIIIIKEDVTLDVKQPARTYTRLALPSFFSPARGAGRSQVAPATFYPSLPTPYLPPTGRRQGRARVLSPAVNSPNSSLIRSKFEPLLHATRPINISASISVRFPRKYIVTNRHLGLVGIFPHRKLGTDEASRRL